MNLILNEWPVLNPESLDAFITHWSDANGSERANYQLFLTGLCAVLEVPLPEPAREDLRLNAYVFERRVEICHPDGGVTKGYIDLYYRQHFVLEAKQTGQALETPGWSQAMPAAHYQADRYVRNLPPDEGCPPFMILTDVGRVIELYAEFTGSGGIYTPFPDPGHHQIRLDDLRDPVNERPRSKLRGIKREVVRSKLRGIRPVEITGAVAGDRTDFGMSVNPIVAQIAHPAQPRLAPGRSRNPQNKRPASIQRRWP